MMDYEELSRVINRANRAWQDFRYSEGLANAANLAAKQAIIEYWRTVDREEYAAAIDRLAGRNP